MSFATKTNIGSLLAAEQTFAWSDWKIRKVHYDSITNSIRAVFKHDIIGQIGGVIKPDFEIKNEMKFSEILENVTLDKMVLNQTYLLISEKALGIEIE